MADVFSKAKRSQIMSKIKNKNTNPELIVRSIIHKMGFRYNLHQAKLPGKPDIVLPRHKKIIQVYGCLWHGHKGCIRAKMPKSNVEFWQKKVEKNKARDRKTLAELNDDGWRVLIVWQCETRSISKRAKLRKKLQEFLYENQTNIQHDQC